jgi:hypothetical protein
VGISGNDQSLLYAMSGVARSGATRCGDTSAEVFVRVGGIIRSIGEENGKILTDVRLSEQSGMGANRATLRGIDFLPSEGDEVVITLGSINNGNPIFAGRVTRRTVDQDHAGAKIIYGLEAGDYTFDANKRLVTKRYTAMAADAIALDILETFAPQISGTGIVRGLAIIPQIDFTKVSVSEALDRIAERIGGYAAITYRKHDGLPIARLFVVNDEASRPRAITEDHPTMNNFRFSFDLATVKTRVFVEGNGSEALADVEPGDTIIPIKDAAYFNSIGGSCVSGPQRISYAAAVLGGEGAIVGPGASPSSAPGVTVEAGSGVESGAHGYAVTFVTAAGESVPSPIATANPGPFPANPVVAATVTASSRAGTLSPGTSCVYTFGYQQGQINLPNVKTTLPSPPSVAVVVPSSGSLRLTLPALDGYALYVCRGDNGGSRKVVTSIYDAPTGAIVWEDTGYTQGSTNEPSSNTFDSLNQVGLSGIAVGPSGTTSRKVYRTAAGGSQLKLLTTIADNTTTTYTDNTPDGSLGANAPTSDTSGLSQPSGQVLPGATSLPVSGVSAFSPSGGRAVIGNGAQVIRYSGLSSTALTGIPASGPGAIAASVTYGSSVTAAALLTGIPASGEGSIVNAIAKGDPVNLEVQVDDENAQNALADVMGSGDDGIREDFIQDRRLSFAEAQDRGRAFLAQRGFATITATFTVRDRNVKVGRDVDVNLGELSTTLRIQSVTIDQFGLDQRSHADDPLTVSTFPRYQVVASNQRFSLEDLLRQIKASR